jgi:zinc transporter 1/2/3
MNCPSRTDDDVLWNPGWNQSPPRFAADLTTCEDLNGIANARELGKADRLRSGTQSLRRCGIDESNAQETEKRPPNTMGEGVKGSPKGLSQLCDESEMKITMLTRMKDLAPEQPQM